MTTIIKHESSGPARESEPLLGLSVQDNACVQVTADVDERFRWSLYGFDATGTQDTHGMALMAGRQEMSAIRVDQESRRREMLMMLRFSVEHGQSRDIISALGTPYWLGKARTALQPGVRADYVAEALRHAYHAHVGFPEFEAWNQSALRTLRRWWDL